MQLESDLKLDRLETFLRKLNNKGTFQKAEGSFHYSILCSLLPMNDKENLKIPDTIYSLGTSEF